MIQALIDRATRDESVYLYEVRRAFEAQGGLPFHCHVLLLDGSTRRFPIWVSPFQGAAEQAFVESYLHATLYNLLSSLGAARMDIYTRFDNPALAAIAHRLNDVFQVALPKRARTGYGCCLNVNERILAALAAGHDAFRFQVLDAAVEPPVPEPSPAPATRPAFARIVERAARGMALGMDIGGTDIKLAVCVDGKLAALKEYDWFPAGFERAEQLIGPILTLTRLMRAVACLLLTGNGRLVDRRALMKEASLPEMERATIRMEASAGEALRGFDAIGLCFPDVVIQNKIVGGETYKTRGMRNNAALDYEAQFARITELGDLLRPYTAKSGQVMLTNDGPMAAFTAAVERAAAGEDVSRGVLAHTLGTELGTGWVSGNGSIPDIPLEVYNFIIDLGSYGQRRFDSDDVRSVNNFNTALPGTLQKYTCQSGVFRLAAKRLPEADPDTYAEAMERGLFVREGEKLFVPAGERDMRKACLEFFMARAASSAPCAEIFRMIGEYMSATWIETQWILRPETPARILFGRLIKHPLCFALMDEGARRIAPENRQYAADDTLAATPLMRQLAESETFTVAQFAQAVGAIYYGYSGRPD